MALRRYAVAAAIIGMAGLAAPAAAAPPSNGTRVLISDLSSPKGIDVEGTGSPVVAQGAFGAPGPVLVYPVTGRGRGIPFPVTGDESLVDVAVSPLDGTGWGLGTDQVLYHQLADGTIEAVLNIAEYQATDPDPVDQDNFPEESNPYGLTVLPNGDALVADAAANDIVRVSPSGDATTVARFDLELVATHHTPIPLPPSITAEAVPTSVTVGPDGAIYVGELKGFPFRPGSSNIWRIEADADGAFCSVAGSTGGCSLYDTGYTAIQDIAFNDNNGRLYVYELAADGVFAFEEGLETGEFPPAVLLEVSPNNHVQELAAGQLSQPGGVAVAHNGKIYVTDEVFTGGRLLQVQR